MLTMPFYVPECVPVGKRPLRIFVCGPFCLCALATANITSLLCISSHVSIRVCVSPIYSTGKLLSVDVWKVVEPKGFILPTPANGAFFSLPAFM